MLEWLTTNGFALVAGILGTLGTVGATWAVTKVFKVGKKVNGAINVAKEDVKVTREGIVEAFKSANIPSEFKITISNQVNQLFTMFKDELLKIVQHNADYINTAVSLMLKILSYTAASDKLTDDEKALVNDWIKQISDAEKTIDITENK